MPLIVFEGIDGAGKTEMSNHLAQYLFSEGWYTVLLREPGGSVLGELVRQLIKEFQVGEHIDKRSEFLLFQASRAQMMKLVKYHLGLRRIVVLDRYVHSSLVYQTLVSGIDKDWVEQVSNFATYDIKPDITLLLDIDHETSIARTETRADGDLGWDEETLVDLRQRYLDLAKTEGYRMQVIDATQKQVDILALSVIPFVNARLKEMDVVKHHPWSTFKDLNPDLHGAQVDLLIKWLAEMVKRGRS